MKEYRDASGRLSIDLGDDGPMFRAYAARLEDRCGAKRVQRMDGLDQSYWDYDLEGITIVLHSDLFAGISVHVEDGSRDDLLRRVAARITEQADRANDEERDDVAVSIGRHGRAPRHGSS